MSLDESASEMGMIPDDEPKSEDFDEPTALLPSSVNSSNSHVLTREVLARDLAYVRVSIDRRFANKQKIERKIIQKIDNLSVQVICPKFRYKLYTWMKAHAGESGKWTIKLLESHLDTNRHSVDSNAQTWIRELDESSHYPVATIVRDVEDLVITIENRDCIREHCDRDMEAEIVHKHAIRELKKLGSDHSRLDSKAKLGKAAAVARQVAQGIRNSTGQSLLLYHDLQQFVAHMPRCIQEATEKHVSLDTYAEREKDFRQGKTPTSYDGIEDRQETIERLAHIEDVLDEGEDEGVPKSVIETGRDSCQRLTRLFGGAAFEFDVVEQRRKTRTRQDHSTMEIEMSQGED